ncbi:MAG: rhodanese-like domain-containing protein [Minisyncoccota bacterium]
MFGFSMGGSEIDVTEAFEHIGKEDHVLLDVRTPGEVREQGIKGAVNVPLDRLEQVIDKLAGYKTIHVICRSGARSGMAARVLQSHGFSQAQNVAGGMIAWERAGLPTT